MTVVTALCRAASAVGVRAEILTFDDPERPFLRKGNIPVHAVGPSYSHYGYAPAASKWLRDNAGRFELLISHNIWLSSAAAVYREHRASGIPFSIFLHGSLAAPFRTASPAKHVKKTIYWRVLGHRILASAHAVFFTSEHERCVSHGTFHPFACEERLVPYAVPRPTPPPRAAVNSFLQRYRELAGKSVVLFMGRLHRIKGVDLLVQAFCEVARQQPTMQLLVVGPDQDGVTPMLKGIAGEAGMADRITWTGPLYDRDKWSAFSLADCFILPSHSESFGVAVAEALAFGIPVLVSDHVGTCPQVMQHGAGISAPDTRMGAVEMLQKWASLPESRKNAMRSAARRCFDREFALDVRVHDIVNRVYS